MQGRLQELLEELRAVTSGRMRVLDALLPPLAYAGANALWGLAIATFAALGLAAALGVWRLIRHQPVGYALGGLAATGVASGLAWLTGRAEGYYLASAIQGVALGVLSILSVLVRRPLMALTSHLARGWPLAWYWQPRVRPAYAEVTWAWAVWFAGRGAWVWILYQRGAQRALAALNALSGWPATVLLLVVTYLYGLWRLRRLAGPSVSEYEGGAKPPWQGQRRGF